MKLIKETSPYIRRKSSVARMMGDVLIALAPVSIFSMVIYGWRAIYMFLLSLVVMIGAECVFVYLTKQDPYDGTKKSFKEKVKVACSKATINNILAPAISAVIYALLLPAGTNWYIVIIGALIGIVIGKLVFGGLGANIFNPAAVGRVSVLICFGSRLSETLKNASGAFGVDVVAGGTPLAQVMTDMTNVNSYSLLDMFLGLIPGMIGETSKVLIILGAIYLFIRRSADFRPTLSALVTFMFLMFIAGLKVDGVNPFTFMLYQTLGGGLIFGAVFMLTDPITSPTTKPGRYLYGIVVAILVVLIRIFGAYPEGVAFSLLIGNMLVPLIDYYKWQTSKINYKHLILWSGLIGACALVLVLGM